MTGCGSSDSGGCNYERKFLYRHPKQGRQRENAARQTRSEIEAASARETKGKTQMKRGRAVNKLQQIDPAARSVPGFPQYFASADGTIWSTRRAPAGTGLARKMSPQRVQGGYLALRVRRKDGTVFGINIHRLVLLAWVGPPPADKPYGCHNNGNIKDCSLANLRWDNAAGNSEDSRRHGTMSVGERHPVSRLTETDVLNIRAEHSKGATLRRLADRFGVGFVTVWQVVNHKTWKHAKEFVNVCHA